MRQDGIPIQLLFQPDSGVKVKSHLQLFGDQMCLIYAPRTSSAHIELLQRNDIGPTVGDHPGHSFRR